MADIMCLKQFQVAVVWALESWAPLATSTNRGSTSLQSSLIPHRCSEAQLSDPTVPRCSQESSTPAQGITQGEEITSALDYALFSPTEKQFVMEKE